MDRIRNPFAPGAGTRPPELAGRDELREAVRIALARMRLGMPTKSALLIGLRGVGKTVLLDRMRDDAESNRVQTIRVEAPEARSLPAMLAPQLRQAILRLSRNDRAKELALRALRGLVGFVKALKIKYRDIEVGIDTDPERGLADNGDLEQDLSALFEIVGAAAKAAETGLALFIDELQYVEEEQLAALITALHRAAQQRMPVMLIGAGLPQLRGQLGRAKSYAERLFDFAELGPLAEKDSRAAIAKPIHDAGADITEAALLLIVERTQGYPYFLQEWGKQAWDVAVATPIAAGDVERATAETVAALDAGFFRMRFERLSATEKQYLRAMADLGPGPQRSGQIAERLGRKVTALAPIRAQLIAKGMVWSPSHGDTAFTVPLFDEFMHRIMPGEDWRG
jgi:hypothetical protein